MWGCSLLVLSRLSALVSKVALIPALSPIVTDETNFRLAHVKKPKYGEKDYERAQETLANLVGTQTVGMTMIGRDDCGRPLIEVYICLEDGVLNVNDEMVRSGWAADEPLDQQSNPEKKYPTPFIRPGE